MANIASMIGLTDKLPFWSMPGARKAPVSQRVREWLSHAQDPVESSASPSREEQEVSERHVINPNTPNNDTTPPVSGYHPLGYPLDHDILTCREIIQQARADPSLARDEASPGNATIPCEADDTFLSLLDTSDLEGLNWLCDNVATRSCDDTARGDIRVLETIVGPARDSHEASPENDTISSEDDEARLAPLDNSSEFSPLDGAMHLLTLMLTRDDLFGEDDELFRLVTSRFRDSHEASLEDDTIPSEDDEARLAPLDTSSEFSPMDGAMHLLTLMLTRGDLFGEDDELFRLVSSRFRDSHGASLEDDESPTEVAQRVPRPKERRDRPRRQKRFDNHSKRNKNNKRFDGASRFRTN